MNAPRLSTSQRQRDAATHAAILLLLQTIVSPELVRDIARAALGSARSHDAPAWNVGDRVRFYSLPGNRDAGREIVGTVSKKYEDAVRVDPASYVDGEPAPAYRVPFWMLRRVVSDNG